MCRTTKFTHSVFLMCAAPWIKVSFKWRLKPPEEAIDAGIGQWSAAHSPWTQYGFPPSLLAVGIRMSSAFWLLLLLHNLLSLFQAFQPFERQKVTHFWQVDDRNWRYRQAPQQFSVIPSLVWQMELWFSTSSYPGNLVGSLMCYRTRILILT